MKRLFGCAIPVYVLLFISACATSSSNYSPKAFPKTLDVAALPPHPRLVIKDAELAQVKTAIRESPELANWYRQLEKRAEEMLSAPTIQPIEGKEGNLEVIRRSMNFLLNLAGLYRLDGDVRKLDRAKKELLAVSALKSWDSDHFLQTAELSFGVAVGYDWLFNSLSPEDRQTIGFALVEKGVKAGQQRYMSRAWWSRSKSNWNPVCNGGLGVAALATAESNPSLSAEILDRAVDSIRISMEKFAPDGGDPEGPMYWNYGTKYNVYLIDGLQTTFGKDYELKKAPGFSKTGGFEMAMIDPIGLRVNFSDSDEGTSPAPEMFWLSREFNERSYYQQELRASSESPSIFHLFWAIHQPPTVTSDIDPNQFFTGVNVVTLRDNWTERAGSFAALKGGNNSENHGHLDLGSFIIDAEGERWAIDLGPDDYDLPGYFDKTHERWTYFRTSTLSHNTLNFDGENQSLKAEAKIIEFHSTPHSAFVMIDLSATYPEKASSILRKVRKEGSNFLIQDEFELKKPTQVTWNFMTRARTLKVKNGLELSQGKSKVTLRILEPKDAKFEIQSAERRPPEERNSGVQMIQIKMKDATGHKRIAVLFETKKPRISVIKPHDLGTEMRGNR